MQGHPDRQKLDAQARAAWEEQVAAAVKTLGLPELIRCQPELLSRFAAYYTQLRALPRRVRRALQRQWRLPLAGIALMLALGQPSAQAATITVNNSCTLVDAITAANTDTATGGCAAGKGADTIVLPAESQQIAEGINNSTYGPTGLPVISSTITIAGNGSTIGRAYYYPFFRILAVNHTGDLTLQETTVSGGHAGFSSSAVENSGGGVANVGGTLTLINSSISGNLCGYGGNNNGGAGVANFGGSLTVLNSSISGNEAREGGLGGGVANFGGDLTVLNSTISENQAEKGGSGGGVSNLGGSLTALNSTISGNSAYPFCYEYVGCFGGYGGAIWNYGDGMATLMNTTITGNFTWGFRAGNVANSGTLTLGHTLIAGDYTGYGRTEVSNYSGTVVADNHNLFGVNGVAGVSGFSPGPTDIVPPAGVQLADILDPTLADNGGPTQTHALVPGSPAIDGGSTDCTDATGAPLTTDQRGRLRPVDGNGDGIRACDIGAFEVQATPVTIDIKPGSVPNPINPNSGGVITVAILTTNTFDATTVDPGTVKFGPKGATEAHGQAHTQDVDGDGDLDLVLHFPTQQTGIKCTDTSASLTGQTFDGQAIEGTDSIRTVGCK